MEDHTATANKCDKNRTKKHGGCVATLLSRAAEKLKGSKPSSTKVGEGEELRKMCKEGMSTPTGSKLLRTSSGIVAGVDTSKEETRSMGEMPPTNWIGGQTFKKTYIVPECLPEGTRPRKNFCN